MEGELLTDEEIIERIMRKPSAQIVLTGGEPSLFIDEEFIRRLKKETGLAVAIETNGTRKLPKGIDWITVSPKYGLPGGGEEKIRVDHADELKIVDLGQELNDYFKLECVGPDTAMLLQPCFTENREEREKNTRRTIERVLEDPRWRLSLQTHRYMGIR